MQRTGESFDREQHSNCLFNIKWLAPDLSIGNIIQTEHIVFMFWGIYVYNKN